MGTTVTLLVILHLIIIPLMICQEDVEEFNNSCLNNSLCENSTTTEIPEIEEEEYDDISIRELATSLFKPSKPNSTKFPAATTTTTQKSVNTELKQKSELERSQVLKASERGSKMLYCSCDMTVQLFLFKYNLFI